MNDIGKYERFLIYIIDTPGNLDYIIEFNSGLRITDGTLVLVDYIEGVGVQTEQVLRITLQELIKPVLLINKCDKAFFEFNHDTEIFYQNCLKIIENKNEIISTYQREDIMGNLKLYPDNGNVAFGSAFQNWGFTLATFAKMYSYKLKIDKKILIKRLWGNNFFDTKKKKWSTVQIKL